MMAEEGAAVLDQLLGDADDAEAGVTRPIGKEDRAVKLRRRFDGHATSLEIQPQARLARESLEHQTRQAGRMAP